MTDRIHIRDLHLRTVIGINEDERRARQDVLINITMFGDATEAARSDSIHDAINYRTITKRIISMVEDSRFYLVEKLAARIAEIGLEDVRVKRIVVRVEKPGALRFARSVGVELDRSRIDPLPQVNRAFVATGSNIDSERNLRAAVQLLASRSHVAAVSPVFETRPIGRTDQPNFLNAACLVETELSATRLKADVLEVIEKGLGRVRTKDKNAPRTIDLDIALFNDETLDLGERHIPDPDILRYAHIAVPLAYLDPQFAHPETRQTLFEIAMGMSSAGLVRRKEIDLLSSKLAC